MFFLEIVWTVLPALAILAFAAPSFALLYLLENDGTPENDPSRCWSSVVLELSTVCFW
jgi:heme/copper-type cytochrome/quinol oxidase subunit 2